MSEWEETGFRTILTVHDVACSDGKRRTFRYHSATGDKGFVKVYGSPVVGSLIPSRNGGYYFHATPNTANYKMLPNEAIAETLVHMITELVAYAEDLGLEHKGQEVIAQDLGLMVDNVPDAPTGD